MQIGNEWLIVVHQIGVALGVSSDALKDTVHYLSNIRFQEKIGIDISHGLLFTVIPGACRVILGSIHPNRYDILKFLLDKHNSLQDQTWESQKKR